MDSMLLQYVNMACYNIFSEAIDKRLLLCYRHYQIDTTYHKASIGGKEYTK
jgi:hypothetical protein